jgi:four helix bundle protein
MARDFRKLRAFHIADELVLQIYKATGSLPEGSSRTSTTEYCRFLTIAHGSAGECRYLLGVAMRLGFLPEKKVQPLIDGYNGLQRSLGAIVNSLCPHDW